jgi:predicted RNase H-like HicB family nuclease
MSGDSVSSGDRHILSFTTVWSIIDLVTFTVETEQETDGRWIAEIAQIPGAMAYGATRDEAIARVEALGLRVLAERIEQ